MEVAKQRQCLLRHSWVAAAAGDAPEKTVLPTENIERFPATLSGCLLLFFLFFNLCFVLLCFLFLLFCQLLMGELPIHVTPPVTTVF